MGSVVGGVIEVALTKSPVPVSAAAASASQLELNSTRQNIVTTRWMGRVCGGVGLSTPVGGGGMGGVGVGRDGGGGKGRGRGRGRSSGGVDADLLLPSVLLSSQALSPQPRLPLPEQIVE